MLRLALFAAFLAPLTATAQPVAEPLPPNLREDGQAPVLRAVPAPALARDGALTSTGAVALSVLTPAAAAGLGLLAGGGLDGLGAVLVISGLAVGPSAGNLVQGAYRDALMGGGVRVVGGVVAFRALDALVTDHPQTEAQAAAWAGAFLIGGVAFLVGTGYDLVTAGTNAHRAAQVEAGVDPRTGATVAVLRIGL